MVEYFARKPLNSKIIIRYGLNEESEMRYNKKEELPKLCSGNISKEIIGKKDESSNHVNKDRQVNVPFYYVRPCFNEEKEILQSRQRFERKLLSQYEEEKQFGNEFLDQEKKKMLKNFDDELRKKLLDQNTGSSKIRGQKDKKQSKEEKKKDKKKVEDICEDKTDDTLPHITDNTMILKAFHMQINHKIQKSNDKIRKLMQQTNGSQTTDNIEKEMPKKTDKKKETNENKLCKCSQTMKKYVKEIYKKLHQDEFGYNQQLLDIAYNIRETEFDKQVTEIMKRISKMEEKLQELCDGIQEYKESRDNAKNLVNTHDEVSSNDEINFANKNISLQAEINWWKQRFEKNQSALTAMAMKEEKAYSIIALFISQMRKFLDSHGKFKIDQYDKLEKKINDDITMLHNMKLDDQVKENCKSTDTLNQINQIFQAFQESKRTTDKETINKETTPSPLDEETTFFNFDQEVPETRNESNSNMQISSMNTVDDPLNEDIINSVLLTLEKEWDNMAQEIDTDLEEDKVKKVLESSKVKVSDKANTSTYRRNCSSLELFPTETNYGEHHIRNMTIMEAFDKQCDEALDCSDSNSSIIHKFQQPDKTEFYFNKDPQVNVNIKCNYKKHRKALCNIIMQEISEKSNCKDKNNVKTSENTINKRNVFNLDFIWRSYAEKILI